MQSDKGFPYSKLILAAGIVLSSIFFVIALFNLNPTDKNAPDWSFFLLFAAIIMFFGVVGATLFPNTLTVRIVDNQIEVCNRNDKELIAISNIKRISASTSIMNQSFNNNEFYKIELKQGSKFGRSIYYKVNSRYNNNFTPTLNQLRVKLNAH